MSDLFREIIVLCCFFFLVVPGVAFASSVEDPTWREVLVDKAALVEGADMVTGFPEKEKLTYRMKWLGITAGELVAEIKGVESFRGRKAYRIEVTARTTGLCSKLYRIEDRYVSYLDAEHFHTLRHEVHRREGRYEKDAVTDFDQEEHKAYFKNATDGSEKVYDIPPHTQDTVTAAYISRFLPLDPGQAFHLLVSNSEKVYDLFFKVVRKQQRSFGFGRRKETFLFQPYAQLAGEEVRKGRLRGFVTTDAKRQPVQIIIKAPVFTSIVATLWPSDR